MNRNDKIYKLYRSNKQKYLIKKNNYSKTISHCVCLANLARILKTITHYCYMSTLHGFCSKFLGWS